MKSSSIGGTVAKIVAVFFGGIVAVIGLSILVFNDMATKYNRTIKAMPTNIIANQLGLTPSEYFQGTESKQEMPQWG